MAMCIWEDVLWADKINVELFGKRNVPVSYQHLIVIVKFAGGSWVERWTWTTCHCRGKINNQVYQRIMLGQLSTR